MNGSVFLAAYVFSGIAGLIYQVTWARLFGLYLGHSTAAAATVLAVFMGGLSAGALLAGSRAGGLTPRAAIRAYALLESLVLVWALAMPYGTGALTPILGRFYDDGQGGVAFTIVRVLVCAAALLVPTISLGATFPLAVRGFVGDGRSNRSSGGVYVANTAGAAIGALTAGFVLLPALGHVGTTLVGAAATSVSILLSLMFVRGLGVTSMRPQRHRPLPQIRAADVQMPGWLAGAIVAVSGFATFLIEIAWMRLLAMVIGPSTYAFSATVAAFITAIAVGGLVGEASLTRIRRRLPLVIALILTASAGIVVWASSYAGSSLASQIADGGPAWLSAVPASALILRVLLIASIVVPGAAALGAVFPMVLEMTGGRTPAAAQRVARLYGVNALASVVGALAGGFALIPLAGLESIIRIAGAALLAGVCLIAARTTSSRMEGLAVGAAVAAVVGVMLWAPQWDREILASGAYSVARSSGAPGGQEPPAPSLRAGTLLYYREGSTGTVSVKRLHGAVSLAIDGKVDASTSGDMLTQKLLAHLPLLMHERPRTVGIIGLGSGVTLASALVHPVADVDVVELSPEVVEASSHFAAVNRGALSDPRTRLIIGDGRTHLLLSQRRYDVIVSEPSNPWMAGVATLFTREFFAAARDRLAPGGILCQWAHTYNMSEADLRSIAATFGSVFPEGTIWRIGDGDLLLLGSADGLEGAVANIETAWRRPGVAADLARVAAFEPFAVLSMFAGGPRGIRALAGGADVQTDDRLALEFSGPLAAFSAGTADSRAALVRLSDNDPPPPPVARALAGAGADEWQRRGAMMRAAEAHETAYADFARAIAIEPLNRPALEGLVTAALATGRARSAAETVRNAVTARPAGEAPWIALSKLYVALGEIDEAIAAAMTACEIAPDDPGGLEQLASIHADLGDAERLSLIADLMRHRFPDRSTSFYYTAAAAFLEGRLEEAHDAAGRAVEIDPGYAQAHNLGGAIQARLGRIADARAAFGTALGLSPRDSAVYSNYGLLELALGNRQAAVGLFREALALDPSSPVIRQGLAEATLVSR